MDIRIDLMDARQYLESRQIDYTSLSEGWINIQCFWCEDRKKHLGIHLESNVISCFRCGTKGSISKIIQHIDRCGYEEACEIAEKYPRPYQQLVDIQTYIPRREFRLPKSFHRISPDSVPIQVVEFLFGRGFNPRKLVEEKELYYAGHTGEYCFRLIIPIYIQKKIVSFIARDTTNTANSRYKMCPNTKSSMNKEEILYGYDEAMPGSVIVLVEGPIDQWKLGHGSLATLGINWTQEQIQLLKTLRPSKVIILFDSESTARKQAIRLSKAIWFSDSEVKELENHKDPGELTLEESQRLMLELV